MPRGLHYAASKAGLVSATRTLAIEFGRKQIRVNSLHCGAIVNDAPWVSLNDLAQSRGTTKEENMPAASSIFCRTCPSPSPASRCT